MNGTYCTVAVFLSMYCVDINVDSLEVIEFFVIRNQLK